MPSHKPIIYQLLTRLFGNTTPTCTPGGSMEQNGTGKLNDITDAVIAGIADLHVTHIWLTGVLEHSHCADYTAYGIKTDNPHVVKGKAGSPYAITDYYDIDPDLAVNVPERMAEFEACVKRIHKAGLKVIIDFVPNHVAREYHSDCAPERFGDFGRDDDNTKGFAPNNNFYYLPGQQFHPDAYMGTGADAYVEYPAKASGNDCFTASPGVNDWYDTVKLNYGVDYHTGQRHFDPIPDTWHRMLDILHYWCAKGVDGFRCDMVHMVPVEFWHWAIAQVKRDYPGVQFIAEIYEPHLYDSYINYGGFDYLYDKVGLYDTLRAVQTGVASTQDITRAWQAIGELAPKMLNFLENHDEQRFASPQYAGDAAKALPSLVVSSLISPAPMMIYFGQELGEPGTDAEGYSGQDGRTTIFDYWSVASVRRWLADITNESALTMRERAIREIYKKVLEITASSEAFATGRFFDLMYVNMDAPGVNPHRHYLFMRASGGDAYLVTANFSAESADMFVNIPGAAIDYLQLTTGRLQAADLMTGSQRDIDLTATEPVNIYLPGYSAAVIKLQPAVQPKPKRKRAQVKS